MKRIEKPSTRLVANFIKIWSSFCLNKKNHLTKKTIFRLSLALLLILFYFCLPTPLFDVNYSTVITDRNHHLLGAHIAPDGQWRFPISDSVPHRFEQCLLTFEDDHFYYHPGVDPLAITRATIQNIRAMKVVSGGSTLTMQTIRLARPANRNIFNKLIEMVLALRLELKYPKQKILALYTAHAPFGANVVGLEAASWRYFARPSTDLSWAEAATLAVLPNAPGLVHPGRNRNTLKVKRDRLLSKLLSKGIIDTIDYELSVEEPIVETPSPLPRLAPHLLAATIIKQPGIMRQTTLDYLIQDKAGEIVERHARTNRLNQVHNAAAIIINNRTSNVMAYIGNTRPDNSTIPHGNDVDVIQSPRSTGSILKPLLYAAALNDGLILPKQMLKDVPTYYSDFSPQNYSHNYDGAIKADEALSRSLNIPFVRLLDDYGSDRFLQWMRKAGFTTFKKSSGHYGLSLILGGGEASLWELSGIYSSMARTLTSFTQNNSRYRNIDLTMPVLFADDSITTASSLVNHSSWLNASAIWFTLDGMTRVNRPVEETGWETFASSQRIAWKTGTSFGYRDAWAIGVTPEYTVAVWVGNASGEGRPGITGGSAAAPILFDLFRLLPPTTWFQMPYDDLQQLVTCRLSGLPASPDCEPVDTTWVSNCDARPHPCPYHHVIHLDKKSQYRVTSACYSPAEMVTRKWFVLPPVMEWYYKSKSPDYEMLPPLMNGCVDESLNPMEFIYPMQNITVYIPKNIQGTREEVVVKIAHRHTAAKVFWSVDNTFLGETTQFHQMGMQLTPGIHVITCTDNAGNRLVRKIKCLNKE